MTATHGVTLIALAPQYAAVVTEMLEAGGDLSDADLAARLDAIADAFGDKVERCQMVYRSLLADAAAVELFAQPYVELAQKRKNAAERLKSYVYACLKQAGQQRVETTFGGARLQKSPPSAKCEVPAETLPEWLRVTRVTFNAAKAIETYKAGQALPEGVRIEVGDHLRWL